MADRRLSLAVAFVALLVQATAHADTSEPSISIDQQTVQAGNITYDYLQSSSTDQNGEESHDHVSTHRRYAGPSCGLWGTWQLHTHDRDGNRQYIVSIFDSCHDDQQVIPTNVQCANDGNTDPQKQPSYCMDVAAGHIPVGLAPEDCMANADQYVLLNANLTPQTYDPSQSTDLTAAPSFEAGNQSFIDRLDERFCTDILSWNVLDWTFRWQDGTTDAVPGHGHDTPTQTHTLAPDPSATGRTATDVTVVAHLHIHGRALDFDSGGNIVSVTRDTFVDISNKAAASGTGLAPVYTPPVLQAGAIAIGQNGDGTIPPFDPSIPAAQHVAAIRGRLLDLYPRAVVASAGTESIGGVVVGTATTTTLSWEYDGGWTDAPSGSGTPPGSTGSTADAVSVQWNHAERLGPHGETVDETVPLTLRAHTVWPDGHAEDETVAAPVAVTIYYVGVNWEG